MDWTRTLLVSTAVAAVGCGGPAKSGPRVPPSRDAGPRPDELPSLVNAELPFHYPAALYARKVQGNVTLRLYIDRDGRVVADSTRVEEPSGFGALDSAAMAGAPALRFVPAKLRGDPIPISLLFPVYFRHPEAKPLPGDSVFSNKHDAAGVVRD